MVILENIDIDMDFLENIDIDIDKGILKISTAKKTVKIYILSQHTVKGGLASFEFQAVL